MFEVILLAGCIQSVLLAFYMLLISQARGSSILGVILLLMSVHIFLAANDSQEFFMRFPHLLHITWVLPALYGPVVLLFIHRVTYTMTRDFKVYVRYFLAFAFVVVVNAPFFVNSAEFKRAYILDFELSLKDDFGFTNQFVSLLHILYFLYGFYLLKKYQGQIDKYTASIEARLNWLLHFLQLVIFVAVLGFVALYARRYDWPVLQHIYPYHFLGILFLIYWSAYRLIKQPEIFHSREEVVEFQHIGTEEDSNLEMQKLLAQKLDQLMQDDKLYRKPGLSLHELCEATESNKQYVSQAINQIHGKSFYDYINDYRLEEFVELMADPQKEHLTLLGLAYDSGFNSKATFNTVFKKKYGVTPSVYQKSIKVGSN